MVLKTISQLFFLVIALCFTVFVSARELPDFTQLIERNSPAVVKINTTAKVQARNQFQLPPGQQIPDIFRHFFEPRQMPERNVQSMGSGFFISADGYILTNNHVIDGADEIVVRLVDRREFEAELVGKDERSDLALLKVEGDKLPFLKLAAPDQLKIGEWVLAIGSPFGLDFSASVGIVSAIGRSIPTQKNENYVPFIQTDVAINPGNSGGPLFNLDGDVVGINSQIYTRSGGSIGLSFAIPSSVAADVVKQLKEKGHVDRGWLGVVIQGVDKKLADSFNLKQPGGALVAQLEPGGPAAKAGLRVGDIIIKFGDVKIHSRDDLPHAVGATVPGEKVPVVLVREGKQKTINVKVGILESESSGSKLTDGKPSKSGSRLGALVTDLDSELKKSWQLSGGVLVEKVYPDTPAEEVGLLPGDVIAQLGFEQIENVAQFEQVIKKLPADSLLPIRFFRQGRPTFRTITLKE